VSAVATAPEPAGRHGVEADGALLLPGEPRHLLLDPVERAAGEAAALRPQLLHQPVHLGPGQVGQPGPLLQPLHQPPVGRAGALGRRGLGHRPRQGLLLPGLAAPRLLLLLPAASPAQRGLMARPLLLQAAGGAPLLDQQLLQPVLRLPGDFPLPGQQLLQPPLLLPGGFPLPGQLLPQPPLLLLYPETSPRPDYRDSARYRADHQIFPINVPIIGTV
jgi:hypothetical protein